MRLLAIAALLILSANAARGADIAIALTDDLVEVDAGFAGAKVVLFGALIGETVGPTRARVEDYDIVAVVRGPAAMFRLRPMLRQRMIWLPGPAIDIGAPEVLLTSATRALDEIAPRETLRELGVGADAVSLAAALAPSEAGAAFVRASGALAVSEAFLDHVRREGRFRETAGAVNFRKGALFSIDIELAPATPVGEYSVDVFLFREGALVSRDDARLSVGKVGIERSVYELAHGTPLAYGLGCVLISLAAGWLAAAAFRK